MGVVVDQVFDFGDGLNEFRAELLLLRGVQASLHQVHTNEDHDRTPFIDLAARQQRRGAPLRSSRYYVGRHTYN